MALVDELEHRTTLAQAVARYEQLRRRDSDVDLTDGPANVLTRDESLELLALSEIIIRKAGYGRQLVVGKARDAGASWRRSGRPWVSAGSRRGRPTRGGSTRRASSTRSTTTRAWTTRPCVRHASVPDTPTTSDVNSEKGSSHN